MSGIQATEEARRRLLGAWEVVSFQDRGAASDPWTDTYGANPSGIILYDASGTVSVQVPPGGGVSDYVGYYGTFEVVEARSDGDGMSGVVEHRMESASTAWLMEEERPRAFEVSGERLILGDQRTARRVLKRRARRT
jgi:hypothetical protein